MITKKINELIFSEKISQTFSERLATCRIEKGFSQKTLAEKCNIHSNTIYLYESRQNLPNIITLAKISCVLNISIDYLLGLK